MNRIVYYMVACIASVVLALPHVTLAAPVAGITPQYSFVEFNIAFILGLSLPILLIIAFLKPITTTSWRYPALMTLSLLVQFYALVYTQQLQAIMLLASATLYVAFACLWVIAQDQAIEQTKYNAIVALLTMVTLGALGGFRELDAFNLWLGYVGVIFIFAIYLQLLVRNESLARNLTTWGLTAGYGITLYYWLNVQLSLVWFVAFAVMSYIAHMVSGCWSMVQTIVTKFEQIKSAVNTDNDSINSIDKIYDPVTNLPTYQQGLDKLNYLLKTPGHNNLVALVFKPLNFEQVNRVLGHQNSDILLLQLAYSLQKKIRENPLLIDFSEGDEAIKLCRLQGLDFLVVVNTSLSEHPNKLVVEDICQQLNQSVPQAISFKSFSLNFQLAFGVSALKHELQNAEPLIAQASDALLEAERSHQQLCHFDQQSRLYTEQQLAKMEKLKQDVLAKKLTWLAHPQVSLSTGQFIGFELEIDWRTSNGKKLSALEFSQVAEYSGEIYQITKQMVQQAFGLLHTMHKLGIEQKVAINLSSKELLEPELADFIEHQVESYDISPNYLTVELTEQVLLGSPFRARMMIDQLRVLGVNIAIDEFSGSYEALRYLRKASVQQVKIECSTLNLSEEAKSEKTIVNALINLIRKMDTPLIATGVDNKDIENAYLLMGGNFAQGAAIQSGISIDKAESWLAAWQARLNKA